MGPSILPAGLWACLQQRTAPDPQLAEQSLACRPRPLRGSSEAQSQGQWGANRTASPSPEASRLAGVYQLRPYRTPGKTVPPLPRAALGDAGVPGGGVCVGTEPSPEAPPGLLASVCRCEDSDPMNHEEGY